MKKAILVVALSLASVTAQAAQYCGWVTYGTAANGNSTVELTDSKATWWVNMEDLQTDTILRDHLTDIDGQFCACLSVKKENVSTANNDPTFNKVDSLKLLPTETCKNDKSLLQIPH